MVRDRGNELSRTSMFAPHTPKAKSTHHDSRPRTGRTLTQPSWHSNRLRDRCDLSLLRRSVTKLRTCLGGGSRFAYRVRLAKSYSGWPGLDVVDAALNEGARVNESARAQRKPAARQFEAFASFGTRYHTR